MNSSMLWFRIALFARASLAVLAAFPSSLIPCLVGGAVLGPALAHADEDTAALVRRGIELRRRGDDEAAVELFWQAWAIDPQPRSCAQLALAEQAVGSFVEAERHLMQALVAENDPWIVRHRGDLELALATIRSRLGTLVIRGGVAGAELRVDGALIGTLPLAAPIRLPAGRFRIDVSADAYYPVTRFVSVVPEQVVSETLVLVLDASSGGRSRSDGDATAGSRTLVPSDLAGEGAAIGRSADEEPRRARDRHRVRRRAAGWSVFGLGGALLAASGVSFGLREQATREFDGEACLAGEAGSGERCEDARRRAIRAERASLGTLVGGAALTATGTVLLVLTPGARAEPRGDAVRSPAARADVDVPLSRDSEQEEPGDDMTESDPRRGASADPSTSPGLACALRVGSVWGGECGWTF